VENPKTSFAKYLVEQSKKVSILFHEFRQKIYEARPGLDSLQFNSTRVDARIQVWVEIVATVVWFLWTLYGMAGIADRMLIPKWWRRKRRPAEQSEKWLRDSC
jgi:hypothetical protein